MWLMWLNLGHSCLGCHLDRTVSPFRWDLDKGICWEVLERGDFLFARGIRDHLDGCRETGKCPELMALLVPQDLRRYRATTVVRVCEVTYDKATLEKDGITVVVRGLGRVRRWVLCLYGFWGSGSLWVLGVGIPAGPGGWFLGPLAPGTGVLAGLEQEEYPALPIDPPTALIPPSLVP